MNKKNYILLIFLIFICSNNLLSLDQNEIITIRKNFVKGNINTKQEILEKISLRNEKEYAIIYQDALDFIQNYYELLHDNTQFLQIGTLAINKLDKLNLKESIPHIRYLFSTVENEEFQIVCLQALSKLIEKDESFTNYLNTIYENGLSDLLSGKKFNVKLLTAYSNALGKFASPSSFDILFKTLLYPIDNKLKNAVKNALKNIFFDYSDEIIKRMQKNDLEYIYTLYELACENKQIELKKLGEISETVLNFAINNFEFNSIIAEKIILKTLPTFSELKWGNIAKTINDFFHIAQHKWNNDSFSTENLVKIIDCMGELGSLENAQSLSIFLGLINLKTETTKKYDEQLVLSTVNALGKLGSKTAFDYLLFVEYLDYSTKIKILAKKAIKELKW